MTERLTPTDTAFWYAGDAGTSSQVGGVVVMEPAADFNYQMVIDVVAARLERLPRYRRVVRPVPGDLARPVWADDTRFDLAYHVRRSSLPRPGTDGQLAQLVGRLMTRPLDIRRPLWELYIVEGLEGGRVALVNKTHESLVNRMSAVDIAAALLDEQPQREIAVPAPWVPAPAPGSVDLLAGALADIVTQPTRALDTARLWARRARVNAGEAVQIGRAVARLAGQSLWRAPPSSLASATPSSCLFAATSVELATVRRVRDAQGGSVNDVILAVICGAARSWLALRGDALTASTSISALAPMSVHSEDTDEPAMIESYLVSLPVGEASAVMRLQQITYQTQAHAASGRQVGAQSLLALGRFAPATLHTMGARVAGGLSRRSYDLLVTNAPGPQHTLYAAGQRVVAMYPVVPLARGHALAIGCTSYRGQVFFGVTADRGVMDDAAEFAPLLQESMADLAETVPSGNRRTMRAGRSAGERQGKAHSGSECR